MKDIKIAFYDSKAYDIESFDLTNKAFGMKIKYFADKLNSGTAIFASDSNVVCAFVNDKIDAMTIDLLVQRGVRIVAMRCAGYNNVDLKAAFGKMHVLRVPEYSPYAVAEHAVALIQALNRKIHRAYFRVRDNNFSINGLMGFDLHGKTAGIIGTGKIGRVMINILRGFGMKILAYDKFQDSAASDKIGFEYVTLNDLYRNSDIISLHCPLNAETWHMINWDSISAMKKGVMIINTGRGHLIDTKSLIAGLKLGTVGSAGLDVYEEESEYFFEDRSMQILGDDVLARLLTFPNVIVTSHQAFFTREAMTNIAETTLQNISAYFNGGELKNEICYRCGQNPCQRKAETKQRCF